MNRLVTDRLWPMLLGLAALLAGALALQAWASRRGNDTIHIVIQDETTPGEEDDASGSNQAFTARTPISEEHARARIAARRGDFAEALPLFAKLSREHHTAAVLGEYGAWLTTAKQPRKALPLLLEAEKLQPSAYGAFRLGLVQSRLGHKEAAEKSLRRAVEQRPNMTAAQIALGNLLRKRGEMVEAVTHLEAASRAGSNHEKARALVALGAAQLALGHGPEAERAFERAIEFAPARAGIRIGIGNAWLSTEDEAGAQKALSVLLRAGEVAPDVAEVQSALGRARERLGDLPAAREAYERALHLDPGYRYARRRLVRICVSLRDFARARAESEHLLAESPDDADNHSLAGLTAAKEGRLAEARTEYRKALDLAGGEHGEALLGLVKVELASGNAEAARAAAQSAVDLDPDDVDARVSLAEAEHARGRRDAAESAYRNALEKSRTNAHALLGLGRLLLEEGRAAEAAGVLEQVRGAEALLARPAMAAALAKAGRANEAIAAYRAQLELEPRSPQLWLDLAGVLDGAGRSTEARTALQRATAADPAHVPSLRALAELDLRLGRATDAHKEFEDLLDVTPADAAARAGFAEALALAGDRAGCESRIRALVAEGATEPRLDHRCGTAASKLSKR
jgi:tetratricopeptide (TPR) repeat protein